jgi:hypothetical protein
MVQGTRKPSPLRKTACVEFEVQGSGQKPYIVSIYDDGTVPYCTCPAWRNSKGGPTQKTCKHVKKILAELEDDGVDDDVADSEMIDLEASFAANSVPSDPVPTLATKSPSPFEAVGAAEYDSIMDRLNRVDS